MKLIVSFVFIVFSTLLFGQTVNRNVVISFWESNIEHIIALDKAKIIEETLFPLEGSWGYALELENAPEDWSKDDFINNLDKIFNEETRAKIGSQTYNDLVHHKDESGNLVFIVSVSFLNKDEDSGQSFESSTMFFFKLVENEWKLYSIEYAG